MPTVSTGFILLTSNGDYIVEGRRKTMVSTEPYYYTTDELEDAEVFTSDQASAIIRAGGVRLSQENEFVTVTAVNAYVERSVKIGIPPKE